MKVYGSSATIGQTYPVFVPQNNMSMAFVITGGQGGGGGETSDYNDLSNKPQINGVTLSGNKTTSDLGIYGLPSYSSSNNGQFLMIVNGSPAWVSIPDANGEEF